MYGEKRISVQNPGTEPGTIDKTEYRVWNPFRSKLAGTACPGQKAAELHHSTAVQLCRHNIAGPNHRLDRGLMIGCSQGSSLQGQPALDARLLNYITAW